MWLSKLVYILAIKYYVTAKTDVWHRKTAWNIN